MRMGLAVSVIVVVSLVMMAAYRAVIRVIMRRLS